ncbi:gliding motility-associated C-terminal domain-containing protein [Ferruginibacter lapsinanis]|uniref:T9SS type B sorting domain-containing protein n=1 Tax=Ferruginibacter lapsinanis TaxID=563172 RepID=UPI001E3E5E96|nr:gliding motility-associated C-terminal domain-containing protein [Ferruginibacter lapsinanis]UEG50796.1 gliding motility-associated C-terminal domain-containing protein [Ferruginibacter lapsinanis]
MKNLYKRLFLICAAMIVVIWADAQCGSTINTFPYTQDLESNDGGWVTGGVNSDWGYGIPRKPIINTAYSGTKCWIIGDPTASNYNGSQSSWLQSPCFDLSSMQYPVISFAFWGESERNFDGTGFQYSLDKGATWLNAGSANTATDCLNQNWFNTSTVRYLPLMQSGTGWSGSTGGWVIAKKALPATGRKNNVIFRFVFGSGSINNNFDGVAIDDFSISEAPPNSADFTYACSANGAVKFTNTSALCPKSFIWDFGDPASGANNTSSLSNPEHTFSAAGTYTITFTVSSPDNAPSTISKTISVLGVSTTITKPINCFGDSNGEIQAIASGNPGPFTYTWNTTPPQSGNIIANLSSGTYTVTVNAANVCTTAATVILDEPDALQHTVNLIPPGCVAPTGTATITETGGTAPYTYSWFPFGGTNAKATGLTQGKYTVTVTDSRSCTDVFDIDVVNVFPPTVNISNITDVKCNGGNNGAATATITGGLDPITYSWNTNPVQTDLTAINLKAGDYLFTVKDANNCTVATPVTINEPAPITAVAQTTNTTCGLKNGSITITPSGNVSDYQYLWTPDISTNNNAFSISSGRYSVQLVNANGCSKDINNIIVPNIGSSSKIFLGKDTTICSGETTILSPGTFDTYLWQNNSTNATFSVAQSGKYWVRVTNADGCVSSDTINVKYVDDCIDIYFPNSFSPNGDGLNDQFGPVGNFNAVSNYTLTVYNRWGQQVFFSADPRKKWSGENNGQISATANYIWFSTYTFRGQGTKFKKGSVIIVR